MFKNSTILFAFFVFALGFSQTNLNAYKYVIIPNQYDFLKQADQFQLNSLSEFLFNKYGFVALKENAALPEDLKNNRCLALTSNVISAKSMFITKLTIVLKDCYNKQVYQSKVGESREKEYKVSYNQALRAAFKSVSSLNHKFDEESVGVTNSSASKKNVNTKTVEQEKIVTSLKEVKMVSASASSLLYAQAIENGFQIVDSTPKVIYKLLKTNVKDVFLVEGREAIIYKLNTGWILEFYENGSLKQEGLSLKF